MSNRVTHKEYGVGQIIPSTEIVGETGLVEQVDILFESGFVEVVNVEDLTEISKDLLQRYNSAANKQINSIRSKRGRKSNKDVRLLGKRAAGEINSKMKLHKKIGKEFQAEKKEHEGVLKHLHDHIPRILSSHGYNKVTTHPKEGDIYLKVHNGSVSTITHPKFTGSSYDILSHKNSTGWMDTHDRFRHDSDDYKGHPKADKYGYVIDDSMTPEEKQNHAKKRVHEYLNDIDNRVKEYVNK